MQGTRLLFRTPEGGVALPAGTDVDLTGRFCRGVSVSAYPAIRVAAANSGSSSVNATFRIVMALGNELFNVLDQFTLMPGVTYSVSYDVPGIALKVFALGESGGTATVDFALFGFTPYVCTSNTRCNI